MISKKLASTFLLGLVASTAAHTIGCGADASKARSFDHESASSALSLVVGASPATTAVTGIRQWQARRTAVGTVFTGLDNRSATVSRLSISFVNDQDDNGTVVEAANESGILRVRHDGKILDRTMGADMVSRMHADFQANSGGSTAYSCKSASEANFAAQIAMAASCAAGEIAGCGASIVALWATGNAMCEECGNCGTSGGLDGAEGNGGNNGFGAGGGSGS